MPDEKNLTDSTQNVSDVMGEATAGHDQSALISHDDSTTPDSSKEPQQSVAAGMDGAAVEGAAVGSGSELQVSDEGGLGESGDSEVAANANSKTEPPAKPQLAGGPINLERIRQLRMSQQNAPPQRKKKSDASSQKASGKTHTAPGSEADHTPAARQPKMEVGVINTPEPSEVGQKITVPSTREQLPPELEDELAAALAGGDLDSLLVGDSSLQVGVELNEGQRIQGKIMKARGEHVFVSLGGPNEGVLPALQFEELPAPGTQIEVVVRGYLADEGLYELIIPGNAIDVSDWDDLREGEVIEVLVTGANSGGLECKAGAIRGFIPASQVAEYRVENLAEMVDQKVLCVVTEANPRRRNLVLSRRAVLEREKREKREERLAALQVGDSVEGTVTKILDFGAFVDIGGLDGLLHISQLSWERVEHPNEILEQGQKIQVRIDKIDEQTGKIGLSYKSLQEHPWTDISVRFPVGSVIKGTVTRIAEFGAFVKIATGVEGLVHVSELAHHRVQRVSNVVQEGQEVDVKVLSMDEENQRISLSIKAVQAAPVKEEAENTDANIEEPPAKPAVPKHAGPLKGGMNRKTGGEEFGLRM